LSDREWRMASGEWRMIVEPKAHWRDREFEFDERSSRSPGEVLRASEHSKLPSASELPITLVVGWAHTGGANEDGN
jgi:hypothetical protein